MKRRTYAWICILLLAISCQQPSSRSDNPYQAAALRAAAWLQAQAIERPAGLVWASDPEDTTTIATDLYSGSSGVVLFFLELYKATGQRTFLDFAQGGADYLLATLPDSIMPGQGGLYTGIAGIGFTLEETYKVSRKQQYRRGVLRCVELLKARARPTDHGVTWNEVTDVISGSAGIGLFLLYAARQTDRQDALDLAIQAGHELIARKIPTDVGVKWAMSPTYPRLMPNFSHGTAGIAYFLVELYQTTGEMIFLEAALQGADYLCSVATDEGFIFHHEPGGEDLFYLGWCHGPTGTARLYYRLYTLTGEEEWMEAIHQGVRSLNQSGIPDSLTPGFWNNVGQCCGSAGVAEFVYAVYQLTGNHEYYQFVLRLTDNLLSRAKETNTGLAWIQAEHRIRPELLAAQTGYMQGAAGIGMWLLHFGRSGRGSKKTIIFPDSPW
jgi:lantibiotic modifying enzyme